MSTEKMGKADYRVLDEIADDETMAQVCARDVGEFRRLSVGFFKIFSRGETQDRTTYFERRHLVALRRLIDRADARMKLEEERAVLARESRR